MTQTRSELHVYSVWDVPTRWFHWINALTVLGLFGIGLIILNDEALGLTNDGKILLKTIHIWIGYIFVLNLAWRFIWAFLGNRYARWRAILPGGQGYFTAVRAYITAFLAGRPQHYLGHNPLGRLGVAALLLLLLIQAVTGLVLAGTDIFYPPFGHWIAQWVAAPGVDPSSLVPYAPEMVDQAAYQAMRAFRKPFVITHEFTFYALVAVIILHVAAVVITELRERGNLVSAMFTGQKILSRPPEDDKSKRLHP